MPEIGGVAWIDPEDAKALIDSGEAVAIDVREPPEVADTGIVPGARAIPLGTFLAQIDPASPTHDASLDPARPVILYCASGKRSQFAGERLVALGFSHVFNLGGLRDWVAADLPVDAPPEQA